MSRRSLLLGLAAAPLASLAATEPLAGLKQWGSGEFRRHGFLVYEATLWAGENPLHPPLALKLTYRRSISGAAIAAASVKEMRQLGVVDEATLGRWERLMVGLFPDVRAGDFILGEYQPGAARFYFNGRWLGSVAEPGFAAAFFGIWLDVRTSAPELREALLRRSPGGAS
ncbi:MAG: chalcone isomerase family protein [Bacteroidota bacterium]